MSFCKKCGAENKESAKFCKGCGVAIERKENVIGEEEFVAEPQKKENLNNETILKHLNEKSDEVEKREEPKVNSAKITPIQIDKENVEDLEEVVEEEELEEVESLVEENQEWTTSETEEKTMEVNEEGTEEVKVETKINEPIQSPKPIKNKKELNPEEEKIKAKKIKKVGIITAVLVLVAVVLGGIGFVVLTPESPEKAIENLKEYVENNDLEKLKKVIIFKDDRLEINDENLTLLVNYIKANESDFQIELDRLSKIEGGEKRYSENGGNLFYMEMKKDGLKEKVKFGIEEKYIELPSDIEGAEFKVTANGKIIPLGEDKKRVGPLMPGEYEIDAKLKNDFVEIDDKKKLNVGFTDTSVKAELFEEAYKNKIVCNEPNALLMIDGVKTEKKASEVGTIVGLKSGTVLQAIIEEDGKTRKSNEAIVSGKGEITLTVEAKKIIDYLAYEEKLPSVVEGYLKGMSDAVRYNQFSEVERYLYPGTKIFDSQVKYINDTHNQGISISYVTHYIDSKKFDESTKEWTIIVKETYDISKDGDEKRETFKNQYKLKVNEEKELLQLTEVIVRVK